ncbi:hypothetical protein TYRP_013224 [Tyrophagus putrescentiae]|nr:hypothetical protein TYRP_013224 [Tyrophagus putrescentiae]
MYFRGALISFSSSEEDGCVERCSFLPVWKDDDNENGVRWVKSDFFTETQMADDFMKKLKSKFKVGTVHRCNPNERILPKINRLVMVQHSPEKTTPISKDEITALLASVEQKFDPLFDKLSEVLWLTVLEKEMERVALWTFFWIDDQLASNKVNVYRDRMPNEVLKVLQKAQQKQTAAAIRFTSTDRENLLKHLQKSNLSLLSSCEVFLDLILAYQTLITDHPERWLQTLYEEVESTAKPLKALIFGQHYLPEREHSHTTAMLTWQLYNRCLFCHMYMDALAPVIEPLIKGW